MLGFRRKSSAPERKNLDLLLGFLSFGVPTGSGVKMSEETALSLPAVMAATRIIAETVASAPINLLDETPTADGGSVAARSIDRNHWAAKLIRRPNEWMTGYEFFEWLVFTTVLFGRALALKNIVRGEIRELLPVRAGWGFESPNDPTGRILITTTTGKTLAVPRKDCLMLSGPSLDAISSLAPVRMLREALGLTAALEIQQASSARSGGRPSGLLSAPDGTDETEIQAVREGWKELFGIGGEGGTPILNGSWNYTPIEAKAIDQQLLETRRFQVEEVARAFRIPSYMLGAGGTQTFASAEAASRDFVQFSIQPWLYRLEQALDRDLLRGENERLRFDIDERALMRGSPNDQAEYYTKALGVSGRGAFMTTNEVRAEQGLPAIAEKWANEVSHGPESTGGAKPADGLQLPVEKETEAR